MAAGRGGDVEESLNVAEAKRCFSELVARVGFGGATVLITRRGRPIARLVPPTEGETAHLGDLSGWLADDDPWFTSLQEIVAARRGRTPRVLAASRPRKGGKKR